LNQPLPDRLGSTAAGHAGRAGRVALTAQRAPDGRTFLARQHATYPFHLCRPHYVASDPAGMATLYLQSIAGGVFEHDRLAVDVAVGDAAALHLTSQGATIVHAMTSGTASLTTVLTAGPGAIVELLPEATILFPGARLSLDTVVSAHKSAVVCVGEAFIAHDPRAGSEVFDHVLSEVRFTAPGGGLLVQDRQSVRGAAFRALSTDSAHPFAACGGLQLWAPGHDLERLRSATAAALASLGGTYAGASILPGDCGLGVRILARDGACLRRAWIAGWQAIRQVLFASSPVPRRK
jgi:urease accessory protein